MKGFPKLVAVMAAAVLFCCLADSVPAADNVAPKDFVALFNGKDTTGWKTGKGWSVEKGVLTFSGKGSSLRTEKEFRNFILQVDWKINKGGDSGVFPRGVAQVQIWDNKEGSGGLWNQKVKALKNADKAPGEWNHFEIRVEKDVITVLVNGTVVVDKYPEMFKKKERGPVVLQNHGNPLWFKNIYIKELPD